MKKLIVCLLFLAAVGVAYLIWDTIKTPLDFEKERKVRYDETVVRLKDIRKAEVAYKDAKGVFSGSWDTLIAFVKNDSLPHVRRIGMLTDSMIEAGLNEKMALKKGLIIRDTVYSKVMDEIFDSIGYSIDELRYIPNSGGQEFWLKQTIIVTGSGIKVPVFEARAHNNQFLSELEADFKQELVNLNEQQRANDRYPGLKVGSVTETNNNAGNWE